MARILVLYYSRTGNTRRMAEAVAVGAKSTGAEVTLCGVENFTLEQLPEYEGIMAGSPTYYGIVAGPMKVFLTAA